MSNYQYRDNGLYGPVTMEKPSGAPYSFQTTGTIQYEKKKKEYENYLASLPRVASVPSSNWKDGEIVEEGKDFCFEIDVFTEVLTEVGNIEHPLVAMPMVDIQTVRVIKTELPMPEQAKRYYESKGGEVDEETKLPERLKQLDSLNKGEEGTKPTEESWHKQVESIQNCVDNGLLLEAGRFSVNYERHNPGHHPKTAAFHGFIAGRATPSVDAGKEAEIKKLNKEIKDIKNFIAGVRKEALKTQSSNTGVLVFVQKLEEAFTWIRDIK